MRGILRKNIKPEDENKKPQRTKAKARGVSTTASRPAAEIKETSSKRTGVSSGQSRTKPPIGGKKSAERKRTSSPKPLCQRSLQRHEAYVKASFEKMRQESCPPEKKPIKKQPTKTRASGSLPPRLPSVRTSQTPSATTRPQRRQWFQPSPEALYRPRSVREAAAQERFRQQIGARPLNLSPGLALTHRSAGSVPLSPEIRRVEKPERPPLRQTRSLGIYGQTPPPAGADTDAIVTEDRYPMGHRYRHRHQDKQKFRLKSQQYQYQRLHQYDDQKQVDSPMAIYERVEEELELA